VVDLKALTLAFVSKLQACPDLVAALGGDPQRIFGYIDNNPDNNSISSAAYEQEPGSVLVGWWQTTFDPEAMNAWVHLYQFYVRAPRRGMSALELLTLLTNGVPDPGDGLRWRICPVMDGVLPTNIVNIERLVDSEGIDYFAVTASTTEIGDN